MKNFYLSIICLVISLISTNAFCADFLEFLFNSNGRMIGVNFIDPNANKVSKMLVTRAHMLLPSITDNTFVVVSHGSFGSGFHSMESLSGLASSKVMQGFDRCLLLSCYQGLQVRELHVPGAYVIANELGMPTLGFTNQLGDPNLMRSVTATQASTRIFNPGDQIHAGSVVDRATDSEFFLRSGKTGNLVTDPARIVDARAKNLADQAFKTYEHPSPASIATEINLTKSAQPPVVNVPRVLKISATGLAAVIGTSIGFGLEGLALDSMSGAMPGLRQGSNIPASEIKLENPSNWRYLNSVNPLALISGIGGGLLGIDLLDWEWTDTKGGNLMRQEERNRDRLDPDRHRRAYLASRIPYGPTGQSITVGELIAKQKAAYKQGAGKCMGSPTRVTEGYRR